MKNRIVRFIFWCVTLCLFFSYQKAIKGNKPWPKKVYSSAESMNDSLLFLGRVLFYDPILSLDSSTSCSSCHSPYNSFAHTDHALSHGIDNKIGFRNAPALINLAYQPIFMWDGAINHLDMQSLAPISNPDEMNESIEHVVAKLNNQSFYRLLFNNAFNDSVITGTRTLKAIAAFIASIESKDSKYDLVMNGQTDFTEQENNGFNLFSKHCSSCHTPPLFTNYSFQNNGLIPDSILKDGGRIRHTKNTSDSLNFKVPTLRNIEFTFPYMHDGRYQNLTAVLNHYGSITAKNKFVAPELKSATSLTANQKVDIIAFLLTLSDKQLLFNKKFTYPKIEIDSLRNLTQLDHN